MNNNKQPHPHAELIKAWADGAKIQFFLEDSWIDCKSPFWLHDRKYRIKPEEFDWVEFNGENYPILGEQVLVRLKVRNQIAYAVATVQKECGHTFFELWDDNFSCATELSDVTHWKFFSPLPNDKQ